MFMYYLYACFILISVYYIYVINTKSTTSNSSSYVINDTGNYYLKSNTIYTFDLPHDESFIITNKSLPISLYLPENPKNGDVITIIDSPDRFGLGNLAYKIKIISNNINNINISGDYVSDTLFKFRGGFLTLIWNDDEQLWISNGKRGEIHDKWSGWYTKVFKGHNSSSYMRIDGTQNPILITYYGGSPNYPYNLIVDTVTMIENESNNSLFKSNYPNDLNNILYKQQNVLKIEKNGIIMDYLYGGGWKKINNEIFDIPYNLF